MSDKYEEELRQNNDYKYVMQDTSSVYLGARFSYEELLEQEMAPFKLKSIIMQYILKEIDAATSLESHFYYMTEDDFAYKTYMELKIKIKVSIPEQKKSITGKVSCHFKEKVYTLKEFVQMNLAVKKKMGIMIQEICISKLGLLSFTI